MDSNLQDRGSSLQRNTTRLQKGNLEPQIESTTRSRDGNSRLLKSRIPVERIHNDSESSASSSPSRNYQKPWPNSKGHKSEELVKHMSNVPSYLQRTEQLQQKALNFGVVDWRRLEKWAYDQQHDVHRRNGNSPSSGYTSSGFSTFGSSTQSCGSSPVQRRKSTSGPASRENRRMKEAKSRHDLVFNDPSSSPISNSVRLHRHFEKDLNGRDVCKADQHGHDKRKNLDKKFIASSISQPPDSGILTSTSDECERTHPPYNMLEVQDSNRLRKPENPDRHGKRNGDSRSLKLTRTLPLDSQDELSKSTEGMCHIYQETICRRSSNVESPTFDESVSGDLHNEDIYFNDAVPPITSSCPLLVSANIDESERADTVTSNTAVPISKLKGKYGKHNQVTKDSIVRDDSKASTEIGTVLPPKHSSATGQRWMTRGLSLRDDSPIRQRKWTDFPNDSVKDNVAASNRVRRSSPLKRILEPFLKPKSHIAGPTVASNIYNDHKPCVANASKNVLEESTRSVRLSKSTAANIDCSTQKEKGQPNSSDMLSYERYMPSGRQALLQLTWTSDTPLLVLTTDDNHVLAAKLQKTPLSEKDNTECIFTITSVHEVQKKNGMWIGQGNKSRKHRLISTVVGQLKVSSSKLMIPNSDSHFVLKQFVLIGPRLMQESDEHPSSCSNSELAAILIKTQREGTVATLSAVLPNDCNDSSCMNSTDEKSPSCSGFQFEQSIVALLPVKIHGSPELGEPSTLVERWKSGGVCDCGGWDEGCTPTILIDKVQESENSDSGHYFATMDGIDLIKLFVQGKTREPKHVFNMVILKEGFYAVEYGKSIASIQALAICIANLHKTKLSDCSLVHDSVEDKSFQEQIIADNTSSQGATQAEELTSYVPHHPPHSPVGRA